MKIPVAFLSLLSVLGALAASEQVRPTPAELVERAKKGPSLLLTPAMIPAARARVANDSDAAAWFDGLCKGLDARRAKKPEVYDRGGQWVMWLNCRKCAARLVSESPTRHVCPGCGEVHSGWPYDDAYISKVNNANGHEIRDCGVAWLLTGDRRYAVRARDILVAYARVYGGYEWHQRNGPEKPGHCSAARAYAQVLDEAVWLCDVLDGYDAVADALTAEERTLIREKLLKPSTATVRSECCYWSNHEVWHLAAFGRAGLVLGDASLVEAALYGKYGAINQLKNGILADGTWYEGSMHYHFYTMRAFTPFFRVLHNLGYPVPTDYRRMFLGPIAQVAPDGMMPPVNDSCSLEYLRPGDLPQHYEYAHAWWNDAVFGWWVRQQPRRSMEYALWGRADAVKPVTPPPPVSRICEGSGLAVLRSRTPGKTDGWIPDNCLMLDFGPHGEWHGHPDKLNVFFWLHGELVAEDPGGINFGSARHWGWYKSTLAHNELRVDGMNQGMGEAELVAFVTNGNASAVAAFCSGSRPSTNYWDGPIYKGVDVLRATALVGDIVFDYLEADSAAEHDYEWCFHARGDLTPPEGVALEPMTGRPKRYEMKTYDCPPLLKGDESWAWVEHPVQGPVANVWRTSWKRPSGTFGLWQKASAPGLFATGVASALPPPAQLTLAVNKVRGKRAVFASVGVPDAAAQVEIGEVFARPDGSRGFKATVNGVKYRLVVRRQAPVFLDIRIALDAPDENSSPAPVPDCLQSGFANPPNAAKPRVWWHWMNGNVTKAGITADLEAMAKSGIGGAHVFDVGCDVPAGDVAFNTPTWDEHLRFAIAEAERLGLELTLVNCSGYANAGGPWVAPSNSMFFVSSTETVVKGGARGSRPLARSERDNGFYRDIAVLAFPQPKCEAEAPKDVTVAETATNAFVFSSASAMALRGVRMSVDLTGAWAWCKSVKLKIETSSDGVKWRDGGRLETAIIDGGKSDCDAARGDAKLLAFVRPVGARHVRFTVGGFDSFAGSEAPARIVRLEPVFRRALPQLNDRTFRTADVVKPLAADSAPGEAIDRSKIVDLTAKLAADGTLDWTAPAGADWIVLRLGYCANGVRCHPCSTFGGGLEVDKLDAAAVRRHLEAYAAKYADLKGVTSVLCDSYEVGSQNWTHGFEKTFAQRNGYSLLPYLAAFSGRVVGSARETDAALRDYRRTLSDLFCENFAGTMSKVCAEHGVTAAIEPYGNGPFDETSYAWHSAQPMTEFWVEAGDGADRYTRHSHSRLIRRIASSSHLRGIPYIDAESFTAFPDASGKWMKDPFGLKAYGDLQYTYGVTRMVYHRWAHQPWTKPARLPGMTMGQWGTHFERTETWWPFVGPWLKYQARCQYLLQQGAFVADLLVYAGDDVPNAPVDEKALPPMGWDLCGKDALAALSVKDGKIVCRSETAYQALVVPTNVWVSPKSAQRIAALKAQGARVVVSAKELELQPDFTAEKAKSQVAASPRAPVRAIHRRYDGGREGYFVAYSATNAATVTCSFRVSGKVPQLWDPETGSVTAPRAWRTVDATPRAWRIVDAASSPRRHLGRTEVDLTFKPCGSVFVMFVPPSAPKPPIEESRVTVRRVPLVGPWSLAFPKGWNCPEKVTLPKLVSWTDLPDGEIRYFSGIAEYSFMGTGPTFRLGTDPQSLGTGPSSQRGTDPKSLGTDPRSLGTVPKGGRVVLELGEVRNLAEVEINGVVFESLWRPPFEVDVTDAWRQHGKNELRIRVANLWPNRLIGDAKKGEDCVWEGKALKEIPDWVKGDRPSPTGRLTFTTWRHWYADDPLLPSGLLGPVALRVER